MNRRLGVDLGNWLGITERVSIYAWMTWVGVFGGAFLTAGDTSSSPAGRTTPTDRLTRSGSAAGAPSRSGLHG